MFWGENYNFIRYFAVKIAITCKVSYYSSKIHMSLLLKMLIFSLLAFILQLISISVHRWCCTWSECSSAKAIQVDFGFNLAESRWIKSFASVLWNTWPGKNVFLLYIITAFYWTLCFLLQFWVWFTVCMGHFTFHLLLFTFDYFKVFCIE